jgi:hypothetical protein
VRNLPDAPSPFTWNDSFERALPDFRSQWLIENCNDKVVKYMKKQDFVEILINEGTVCYCCRIDGHVLQPDCALPGMGPVSGYGSV